MKPQEGRRYKFFGSVRRRCKTAQTQNERRCRHKKDSGRWRNHLGQDESRALRRRSSDLQCAIRDNDNPWDVARTYGGSSGGPAMVLAVGATALEIGSDIGGSFRIPANFCGVFAHKPTYRLVSQGGFIPWFTQIARLGVGLGTDSAMTSNRPAKPPRYDWPRHFGFRLYDVTSYQFALVKW